jgi:acyl dehydratase
MMTKESLITQEIEAMVGKEEVFSSPEEIGRATIHRFAAAIGDSNPLYLDEEFARNTRHGGIIAPPTMIFELNHNLGGEISEEDGGYLDKITLPAPLTRFIRGGNEYEFFQPARPEDKITLKREVTQVFEKRGKAGPLVFVKIEITYTNQKGELLGINRETLIFMPE